MRQNFQHGKRQRELAKKQKKEEKLQRKMERKNNPGMGDEPAPEEQEGQPGFEGESEAEAEEESEPAP